MNVNPHFRYYAALVLILMLVLMLRVQVRPAYENEQAGQDAGPAAYYAAGSSASR